MKRETILFFPGWPRMIKLLKPFLKMLEKNYRVEVFDENFSARIFVEDSVIGLAYSAGAIDLARLNRENQNLLEKMVFIAPAGANDWKIPFPVHCGRFLRETFELLKNREFDIFQEAIREIICNFIKNPVGSLEKINQIRKFDLWRRLDGLAAEKSHFIFSFGDRFIKPTNVEFFERMITTDLGGHFGLAEKPEDYFNFVKDVLIK